MILGKTAFATMHCKSLASSFGVVESSLYQQHRVQAHAAWQTLAWRPSA